MTEAVRHEPGIYFDLPAETYHQDDALGSSSIKALSVDPYEYQFDRLYGEDLDNDALTFGSALHARLLEGREEFERQFCQKFDKSMVEGALGTSEELKNFLKEHDQVGFSSLTKPKLINLVQEIAPEQPIADVLKAEWAAKNAGKTELNAKRWAQVETAARWVQRDPLLSEVMTDGTFSHGAPEVSVFYEDRGVRLKARFDRLLSHAIIDLKTFSPVFDGPIDGPDGTAIRTIKRMRYGIQAAAYLRAWEAARDLYQEGRVFGDQPQPEFLDQVFDRDLPSWIWILVKAKGAPQPLVMPLDAPGALATKAGDVEHAINNYIELSEQFGANEDWVPQRPPMTLTDKLLPYGL